MRSVSAQLRGSFRASWRDCGKRLALSQAAAAISLVLNEPALQSDLLHGCGPEQTRYRPRRGRKARRATPQGVFPQCRTVWLNPSICFGGRLGRGGGLVTGRRPMEAPNDETPHWGRPPVKRPAPDATIAGQQFGETADPRLPGGGKGSHPPGPAGAPKIVRPRIPLSCGDAIRGRRHRHGGR